MSVVWSCNSANTLLCINNRQLNTGPLKSSEMPLWTNLCVYAFVFFCFVCVCPHTCLFMCNARWSDRLKALWQSIHSYGFCPVCFRKCLVSSSERANFHPQPSHEQWYGFSPEDKKEGKEMCCIST